MKQLSACIAFALLIVGLPGIAHAQSPDAGDPDAVLAVPLTPDQEKRARELNTQLRCPVCQGASIEESPVREATEMKVVVREQVAAGKSDDEIRRYFISRYGEWVVLAPPARGFNLLVYMLPVLLVLAGGVFVYTTARRWTRNTA